jgi:hypothetical protein
MAKQDKMARFVMEESGWWKPGRKGEEERS